MKKILVLFMSLALAFSLAACRGKSDADLKTDVENKLKADNVAGLTVDVKDGVATLKGEVADQAAMDKVKAMKVEGVKEVKFADVKVKPTPLPATADTGDKTKIQDALTKAGFKDVTVDTSTTPATIRGTVPKGKLAEAVKVAQEAAGKPVKNEVTEK